MSLFCTNFAHLANPILDEELDIRALCRYPARINELRAAIDAAWDAVPSDYLKELFS